MYNIKGTKKKFRPFKKRKSTPTRYTEEYNRWRKKVYDRDNHTCQVCGRKNIRCVAHHIKSYKNFKLLRCNIKNGITLCYSCHKKFHDKFGKKDFPNIVIVYNLNNKEKYIK
jgi:5-methylcytosine-specific restriction endonuclease McrA